MENVTKYKGIYDSAYDKLQELDLEKFDLVKELQALVAEDTALNQPPPPLGRGRRLRRSTHNKGKKRRRSTHKRKKRLMQN
jgi:hypothetical protein